MNRTYLNPTWKLLISIIGCELIGILSGVISASGVTAWFLTLRKPSWNPPSWLFGPVWTILYCLMGIAWYLIWKSNADTNQKKTAFRLFAFQLLLNFFWSILFFKFHQPFYAFIEIIFMLLAIILTMNSFYAVSKTATWLLVPYLLWVSFATFLNFTIWTLNS